MCRRASWADRATDTRHKARAGCLKVRQSLWHCCRKRIPHLFVSRPRSLSLSAPSARHVKNLTCLRPLSDWTAPFHKTKVAGKGCRIMSECMRSVETAMPTCNSPSAVRIVVEPQAFLELQVVIGFDRDQVVENWAAAQT